MSMRKDTLRSLKQDFSEKDILGSLFGAILLGIIFTFPIFIALGEVISVLMIRLTLWLILIIIAMFGLVFLIHYLWGKSLLLKKKEIETDIKKFLLRSSLIVNGVIAVLGTIFILFIIPILLR